MEINLGVRYLCTLLLVTILCIDRVYTQLLATYKMEGRCGDYISFPSDADAIKIIYSIPSEFKGRCSMYVYPPDGWQLSYWLDAVTLNERRHNCVSNLTLKSDTFQDDLCLNSDWPDGLVRSAKKFLFILFYGDSSKPPYLMTGFSLTITAFHTGSRCSYDEKRCLNGRCVASDLWCTDLKPCGYSSSSCDDKTAHKPMSIDGTVIAMITVSLLVIIIIMCLLVYIRQRKRLTRNNGNTTRSTQNLFSSLRNAYDNFLEARGPEDTPARMEPPPAYDELDHDKPPAYNSVMSNQEVYNISGSVAGSVSGSMDTVVTV